MSKIKQLTQSIRNYTECELDYGTIRTLKMIDDEADRLEKQFQKTSSSSDHAKCTAEVLRYIKYSKDSKAGRDIAEIIKKHFA